MKSVEPILINSKLIQMTVPVDQRACGASLDRQILIASHCLDFHAHIRHISWIRPSHQTQLVPSSHDRSCIQKHLHKLLSETYLLGTRLTNKKSAIPYLPPLPSPASLAGMATCLATWQLQGLLPLHVGLVGIHVGEAKLLEGTADTSCA